MRSIVLHIPKVYAFLLFQQYFDYNDCMQESFEIILFYKYVAIDKPNEFMYAQKALCEQLGLKGRVIIAREGVNATLEGSPLALDRYCAELVSDPRFTDVHFKRSVGTTDGSAFPRLSVKVRAEIVSGHFADGEKISGEVEHDIDPTKVTGKRLKPEELRAWIDSGKVPGLDFEIIDMRNDYEHAVGHFEGSILPPLKNFRDLPKAIHDPALSRLKAEQVKTDHPKGEQSKSPQSNSPQSKSTKFSKPILTVCTGGVRCEKASGYLIKQGFENVYQLDGGIVSYMEKYPGRDFLGSLYVFDKRHTMHFDSPEVHAGRVIGKCALCGAKSETYTDCLNDGCHSHFIACSACSDEQGRAMCSECGSGRAVASNMIMR
jgi:UPF0176 protein